MPDLSKLECDTNLTTSISTTPDNPYFTIIFEDGESLESDSEELPPFTQGVSDISLVNAFESMKDIIEEGTADKGSAQGETPRKTPYIFRLGSPLKVTKSQVIVEGTPHKSVASSDSPKSQSELIIPCTPQRPTPKVKSVSTACGTSAEVEAGTHSQQKSRWTEAELITNQSVVSVVPVYKSPAVKDNTECPPQSPARPTPTHEKRKLFQSAAVNTSTVLFSSSSSSSHSEVDLTQLSSSDSEIDLTQRDPGTKSNTQSESESNSSNSYASDKEELEAMKLLEKSNDSSIWQSNISLHSLITPPPPTQFRWATESHSSSTCPTHISSNDSERDPKVQVAKKKVLRKRRQRVVSGSRDSSADESDSKKLQPKRPTSYLSVVSDVVQVLGQLLLDVEDIVGE